mmetsp:Transcript_15617/g.59295  ORF Transcript_15617/g.59295 Transcript_15617/m.59295 type:complete len:355 (+) Transcript_15617:1272-2336(+)
MRPSPSRSNAETAVPKPPLMDSATFGATPAIRGVAVKLDPPPKAAPADRMTVTQPMPDWQPGDPTMTSAAPSPLTSVSATAAPNSPACAAVGASICAISTDPRASTVKTKTAPAPERWPSAPTTSRSRPAVTPAAIADPKRAPLPMPASAPTAPEPPAILAVASTASAGLATAMRCTQPAFAALVSSPGAPTASVAESEVGDSPSVGSATRVIEAPKASPADTRPRGMPVVSDLSTEYCCTCPVPDTPRSQAAANASVSKPSTSSEMSSLPTLYSGRLYLTRLAMTTRPPSCVRGMPTATEFGVPVCSMSPRKAADVPRPAPSGTSELPRAPPPPGVTVEWTRVSAVDCEKVAK